MEKEFDLSTREQHWYDEDSKKIWRAAELLKDIQVDDRTHFTIKLKTKSKHIEILKSLWNVAAKAMKTRPYLGTIMEDCVGNVILVIGK
jgi:hypothetical protein